MKVIKSIAVMALFASSIFLLSYCGDGGKAAKEKLAADSIRVADSLAAVKAKADSIAALPKPIAENISLKTNLSTLTTALQAAELATTLNGPQSFTVFAPTNESFAAAQKTVDMLMKPESKTKLQNVLKYHVVAGSLKSTDLTDGQELVTLQGEKLKVKLADGKVMVGSAEVTTADVAAENGTIHIVNKVLVPKKM